MRACERARRRVERIVLLVISDRINQHENHFVRSRRTRRRRLRHRAGCSCARTPENPRPAADATLASAPHEVAIDFSETLEPAFSSIVVTDSHGQSVADGKSTVDAGNRKRMHVALASLAAGTYTVAWVAVASDGHRTQGRYTFTVK